MGNGRDENGRFVKGHVLSKGTGRPPKKREEQYYNIIQSACTPTQWRRIADRAVVQAERGDAVARKWLSDYLIGQPTASLDITSGGERILDRDDATLVRELNSLLETAGARAAGATDGTGALPVDAARKG